MGRLISSMRLLDKDKTGLTRVVESWQGAGWRQYLNIEYRSKLV